MESQMFYICLPNPPRHYVSVLILPCAGILRALLDMAIIVGHLSLKLPGKNLRVSSITPISSNCFSLTCLVFWVARGIVYYLSRGPSVCGNLCLYPRTRKYSF
ncbi:hypothetical protein BD779DRAFT_1525476, partial [Infundibulicybe gibba]